MTWAIVLLSSFVNAGLISKIKGMHTCMQEANNGGALGTFICDLQKDGQELPDPPALPAMRASVTELTDIQYYLDYAGAAYCAPGNITTWQFDLAKTTTYSRHLTDVVVTQNAEEQTVGYTGYNKGRNEIIITFRGTVTTENWISESEHQLEDFSVSNAILDIYNTAAPVKKRTTMDPKRVVLPTGARVSHGFQHLCDSLMPGLAGSYGALLSKYPNATRTVVTGHSLGAAMAAIASAKFKLMNPKAKFRVALYGAPRPGTPEWVEWYHKTQIGQQDVYRSDNHYDPVLWTPTVKMGYRAVGQEFFMTSADPNMPSDPEMAAATFQYTTKIDVWKCATTPSYDEDPACAQRDRYFDRKAHSWYFGKDIEAFCTPVKVEHSLRQAIGNKLRNL